MRKKNLLTELNEMKMSYLFILPAIGLFLVFIIVPIFFSFFLSFTKYNVFQAPQWIGLGNYKQILMHDERFWKTMRNTLFYVVGVVPIGVTLALILAIAVDQKIRAKNFFKTMFFLPTVTSIVAVSVIWKWMLAGEKYGLINNFLMKFGIQPIDWLMSVQWTLPSIMIMDIWRGIGYNMLLFLAGLQTIPKVMYEAADIDGAGTWDKFWNVTLPLLRPTMVFVGIMAFIVSFQMFDQVYIMTGGESGIGGVLDCALTGVPYLYDEGFSKFRMGYASALAYIIFGCIMVVTLANMRFLKTKVKY
ncbi:MAG: sugar ABC transporter permease [Candidatus Omnitrophica bacterium]|nr:sugar ABC transporter permease [Candidatus Omnitrophota bacterium]